MPHKRASHSARKADRLSKGHDLAPSYKVGSRTSDPHFNAVPKGAARIINGLRVQQEYRARKKAEADKAAGIVPEGDGARSGDSKAASKGKGKEKAEDATKGLKIRPGEKMRDFNSRVEQAFAPKVLSAARSIGRAGKRKRRAEAAAAAAAKEESEQASKTGEGGPKRPLEKGKGELKREREELEAQMSGQGKRGKGGKEAPLEFAKLEQRKSVRDVVEAPPKLTKAPRGEGEEAKKRKQMIRQAMGGGGEDMSTSRVRLPDPVRKKSKGGEAETPAGGLKRKADLEEEREKAIKAYRRLKGRE